MSDFLGRMFDAVWEAVLALVARRARARFGRCGKNVFVSPHSHIWAEQNLEVGDDVCIHAFTHIFAAGSVKIGDGAMISSNCSIASITHVVEALDRCHTPAELKPVVIGRNVWIGVGAVILPGVSIGEHSVIGGGAVVTKDIPACSVAVGNPARVIRTFQPAAVQP